MRERVQLQGVLFDMDGVLVSSLGSAERCWRRWAAHYGVPGAETLVIPHGVPARDIVTMLAPGIDQAEGVRLIETMEVEDVAGLTVFDGVRELLATLPAERWAIVTSATKPLVDARLKAGGLPVPERMITAEMVTRGKPDPEPYRRGAELLGFRPEECVVVEDAPSGVRAGIAAGCRVLAVLSSHKEQELQEAGATWVVGGMTEVQARVVAEGLEIVLG